MQRSIYLICLAGLALLFSPKVAAEDVGGEMGNWPQWRGPDGSGMARSDGPLRWSDTENIKWRTEIPGKGHSTPVIWGDKIFITTAVPTGKPAQAAPAAPSARGRRGGSFHGGGGPQVEHSFDLLCIDKGSGNILWQKSSSVATPHEGHHGTYGSFASNSAVTDGSRVYAFYGSRGIYCYEMDGTLDWHVDLGRMQTKLGFGEGASPTLHGDRLIINFDHDGDSFIVALDKNTGEEIWRTPRNEATAWSTPLVVAYGGARQVVVSATSKVRSYDFLTGELIWECAGLGANAIPAPVTQDDLVYVMTGFRPPRRLMAIRLGHEGDLTGTDAVVWTVERGTSYTPSPVLHENKLYMLMDSGMISCVDATSGEPYYMQQRLPGSPRFKASPVGAQGKLYLASEGGEVFVLKMGPDFEVLATNTLEGQSFVASPAIVDGELFLRSQSNLICVAQAPSN